MSSRKPITEYQGSTKEYLIALCTNTNLVKLINKESKPYQKVCQWIIDNEERSKSNYYVPTIKEVSDTTELKPAKVTQFLKDIYNDILLLNENEPEKFAENGSVICYMHFNYLGRYASFSIGLRAIPRIGDYFDFHFIVPKTGGNYFFVNSISHIIENNKQYVSISLSSEESFLYLELLKQKEYLGKWISHEEFLKPMTDSLKGKLLKGSL
jgi:hypothetical protein